MKLKKLIIAGCLLNQLVFSENTFPKPPESFIFPKKGDEKLSWIFGIGWNAVDDNGRPFRQLFSVRRSWNLQWYPTQASAEVIGKEGMTYGAIFNFNLYKSGKEINSKVVAGVFPFFSLDLFAKYHFNAHIKMSKRYDPYVMGGFGNTLRFFGTSKSTFTFNLGGGMNFWINEYIGINLQTVGKIGIRSPFIRNNSNYMQHSAGLVFMLDRTYKKKHSFVKPRYKWVHDNHKLGERLR